MSSSSSDLEVNITDKLKNVKFEENEKSKSYKKNSDPSLKRCSMCHNYKTLDCYTGIKPNKEYKYCESCRKLLKKFYIPSTKSYDIISCECGMKIIDYRYNGHMKSKKHLFRMTLLNYKQTINNEVAVK